MAEGGRRRVPQLVKRSIYNGVAEIITGAGKSKSEWTDFDILDESSLPLPVLSEREAAVKIVRMLDGLAGAAEVDAYLVLVLSWNMRSKNDPSKRIFPSMTPMIVKGRVEQLSTTPLLSSVHGSGHVIKMPADEKHLPEFNRQGCFYAASLLKLFTKESDSWMKAQEHIAENYKKFTTGHEFFLLKGFPVLEGSVSTLRRMFQTDTIYRKTLGMILYSLPDIQQGREMTMMLFEQHLSFTGLHIIDLFCKALSGLRTSRQDLMKALHLKCWEPTLDQLDLVLRSYMGSTEDTKWRETYKFARLYDTQMFSLLQTKNCAELVCILGHIGNECGNVGMGNVMDIAAIQQMGDLLKKNDRKVAHNIFTHFRASRGMQDKRVKESKKPSRKGDGGGDEGGSQPWSVGGGKKENEWK